MVLPFEKKCREDYYKLLDDVFDSDMWSDGEMQRKIGRASWRERVSAVV